MLTYRRFTLLFFLFLACLNLVVILPAIVREWIHPWLLVPGNLIFVVAWVTVSVAMAFLPCSGFHHPVICRGFSQDREVAITFDDGPNPDATLQILDTLTKHDAPATFFCTGRALEQHESIGKQIVAMGHVLGNHSWSHAPWFDLLAPARIRDEMERTDRRILSITGKKPAMFRPPFGVVNPMMHRALQGSGRHVVCWDIRSLDTLTRSPQKITHRILSRLRPGSIILLHDHTRYVRECLGELLAGIGDAGFKIVPLEKIINVKPYE